MTGDNEKSTPIAQSLIANVQLGLPATASRISSKIRFINKIAPGLKEGGVVRNILPIKPLTIEASGIASSSRTTPAFGGILYISAACGQNVIVKDNSIYKTEQESIVDVDETDDLDLQKKLKFLKIISVYQLLDKIIEKKQHTELLMVDTPLLLELADIPLEDRTEMKKLFDKCKNKIENFWEKHKDQIFPFNPFGIKLVSVGNKRFGAIFFALADENIKYVVDPVKSDISSLVKSEMSRLQGVGIKRLLNGILTKCTRTAAFQFDGISDRNRLEPEKIRKYGLIGMHIKAGNNTPPTLIETLGSKDNWTSESLDELAAQIISLINFDQKKALPLPLWYAKYSLKPVDTKPGILEFYKAHAKEILQNESLENNWKQDFEVFEE